MPSVETPKPSLKDMPLRVPDMKPEKEKSLLDKLGTAVGDTIRDIDTANKMAKDKFEGDTALMRTAKGFVSTGVGVGLEKSMDFVWEKIWQGEIPYYDKTRFGEGMAGKMNEFAGKSDLNARLYYLIKESTQDLTMAIFYNFLAFRSQPLLEKAKSQHLVGSLVTNIVAAATLPSLPAQMQFEAATSTNKMIGKQQEALGEKLDQASRGGHFDRGQNKFVYPQKLNDKILGLDKQIQDLEKTRVTGFSTPNIGDTEKFFLNVFDVSNPVTQLGVDMVGTGISTLIKNFKEVHKLRREKGGLAGKSVPMPKKEDWRPRTDNRRQEGEKKWAGNKVYYGQSKQDDDLKRLEEYDLKGA